MPFMKPYMVKLLREQFPPGTRIRLDSMMNDPQPIPKGMTGTVQGRLRHNASGIDRNSCAESSADG